MVVLVNRARRKPTTRRITDLAEVDDVSTNTTK